MTEMDVVVMAMEWNSGGSGGTGGSAGDGMMGRNGVVRSCLVGYLGRIINAGVGVVEA